MHLPERPSGRGLFYFHHRVIYIAAESAWPIRPAERRDVGTKLSVYLVDTMPQLRISVDFSVDFRIVL